MSNYEYQKKWVERNKEFMKEYNRIYREKNREKLREYQRQYYHENSEEIKKRVTSYNYIKKRVEYKPEDYQKRREKKLEAQKKYYYENRERILAKEKLTREKNKPLTKILKPVTINNKKLLKKPSYTPQTPVIIKKDTTYIKNKKLVYHTIISQGKGYPTQELQQLLYTLSTNFVNAINFSSKEQKEDAKQECYISLHTNYNKFNIKKTENAFAYFSEICKRSTAAYLNLWNQKKWYLNSAPSFIHYTTSI